MYVSDVEQMATHMVTINTHVNALRFSTGIPLISSRMMVRDATKLIVLNMMKSEYVQGSLYAKTEAPTG